MKQVNFNTGKVTSPIKSFVWKSLGLSFLLIGLSINGTAQNFAWEENFGGSDHDYVRSSVQTSDGGYAIAGNSESSDGDVGGNNGKYDYWVVKLNDTGAIQWEKNFGGSANDYAKSIIQTSDGGYAIAGRSESSDGDVGGNNGSIDYWVVKLDNTGALQWEKHLGGSNDDEAHSIVQTPDSGFAIAGFSNSSDGDVGGNNGKYDYWVVKLDKTGALQWEKNLGGSDDEKAYSIVQTSGGGFALAGYSFSSDGDIGGNNGSTDSWIVKLDNTGAIQWEKNLGGSNVDLGRSIVQTSDSGFAIAGRSKSSDGDVGGNNGRSDYWVVKLNSTGALQWEKNLGGSKLDRTRDIVQTLGGGYAIAGYTKSSDGDVGGNYGVDDYWLVKLDNTGALQWEKNLGGSEYDVGISIVQTSDGGYATTGFTSSSDGNVGRNNGGQDYWMVKLSCTPGTDTINRTACNAYQTPSGDTTYTQSGTYKDTLDNASANGCDSIITINLTINNSTTSTINPSVCNRYEVPSGDTVYTQGGTYTDTLENANIHGCDSIITINLTINNSTTSTINPTACHQYEVPSGDTVYTEEGTYFDTLENANAQGCDSIISIHLTIRDIDSSANKTGETLKANTSGATYQWLDCDNGYAKVPDATGQSFTPSANGHYAVSVTKNNCTDTSSCYQVQTTGIASDGSKAGFDVYPNPAADQLTIVQQDNRKPQTFELQTLTGQRIKTGRLSGTATLTVSHLSPGIYVLEVQGENAVRTKKVVVE